MLRLRSTTTRAAITLGMTMIACGATATDIYLGEYKFDDPKLYVMGPGGADPLELDVIPTADWLVVGLFVDAAAQHVYWTHGSFNQGRIRRANLDGTGLVTLVPSLTNPRGLAVDLDGESMYWSDTQDLAMYRADLDGTDVTPIVQIGRQLGRPTLDVAAGKLYFGSYDSGGAGDLRRTNLDGSGSETLVTGLWTPVAVALDVAGGKIYWADSNTSFVSNHIARANFDGSDVEILHSGEPTSSGFTGIGLDLAAGKLYWSDEITAIEKGVWEANLDGTDAERIFESPSGWNAGAMVVVAGVSCAADLDGDGIVGFADVVALLAAWGPCLPGPCEADLDGNGDVGFSDLVAMLAVWGPC